MTSSTHFRPVRSRPRRDRSTIGAAAAAPPLYLVGGRGAVTPRWAADAGALAGRWLGAEFAPVAMMLAREIEHRAPLLLRDGRFDVWSAAVVFLVTEEAGLFNDVCCSTRTQFAREVGISLPLLRRRVAAIRIAITPLPTPRPVDVG